MTRAAALSFLAPRCDEEGSCLIWRRAVNSGGSPVASIDGKSSRSVRRWVWSCVHGEDPGGLLVIPACGHPRCLAPGCLVAVAPGMVNTAIAERGGMRTPARRAACRRSGRMVSRLKLADVRVIRARRAAGETLATIARYYGVSISAISRICRGESWHDPANPFTGLMAA